MNTISIIKSILNQSSIEHESLFHVSNRQFHVSHANAYQQWNGPISSFGENTGDVTRQRENLLNEITGIFYKGFYMTGNVKGEWYDEYANPNADDRSEFMQQLSAANQTQERWDMLWTVVNIDNHGNVEVQKNGISKMLVHQEWQPMQSLNGPLKKGMQVSVLLKKERKDVQPVFYYVNSAEPFSLKGSLCRFYFNVKPEHIAKFIKTLSKNFNESLIPFMFKCLNHPSLYIRADGAVLYIEKKYFGIAAKVLKELIKQHQQAFNAAVPLFSLKLQPGLGFAEDPGNGKSFGMNWSELLAEALIRFYETETSSDDKKEAIIHELIKKKGLSLEHSYLNHNSFYPYQFNLLTTN
ncbi:MAG: T3SS effector HopA1 family protein [Bacteroidia bacterium]|nr:T3SS effector HopA1 family protein [Bacteroidia bacterium]